MSRLYIAVTGANNGVGFGACQRLLEQLSSEHQTDGNPQFDIPVESKDVPDERPRWSGLTLIMVCRNVQRAEAARGKLLSYLDQILEGRKARGALDEYGQNFRQNLVIGIEKCDFTSVESVVGCARGMRTKYPYLNHLVLNAGAASFVAIDWFKLIVPFILHPIISLTVVSYIIQAIGERTHDGFGYIWQCNVFGPYLFYRELQPLLEAFHSRSDVDCHYPSRVLWTSSLEATHFYRPEDWQLVTTDHSYESSKYQVDLLASQLEIQALRLEEQTNRPAKVRHLIIHPGVASTGIVDSFLHPILVHLMGLSFYLARFLGSPHHPRDPHTAGIAATHTLLTPLENLPNPQRHSKCLKFNEIDNEEKMRLQEKLTEVRWVQVIDPKDPPPPIKFGAQTDCFGNPRVGVTRVKQWKEYEPESRALVDRFEGLYKSLILDHPEKFRDDAGPAADVPVVQKRRSSLGG
ncbi:3-keto sterol reductase [Thelephora terrestris]|uniref:3-keto sterol reductase n=1 Tax=Thelephora terrestris TaxID=56493 RepID=A0A9P6L2K7_9AGAM|nr:3-keto sterol reductase [Thelephora terrestris]